MTPRHLFLETNCTALVLKDAPCQTSIHLGQWFMVRRRFLMVFAIYTYIKLCSHRSWTFVIPGTLLNLFVLSMIHAKIVPFDAAILKKNMFKHFLLYHLWVIVRFSLRVLTACCHLFVVGRLRISLTRLAGVFILLLGPPKSDR